MNEWTCHRSQYLEYSFLYDQSAGNPPTFRIHKLYQNDIKRIWRKGKEHSCLVLCTVFRFHPSPVAALGWYVRWNVKRELLIMIHHSLCPLLVTLKSCFSFSPARRLVQIVKWTHYSSSFARSHSPSVLSIPMFLIERGHSQKSSQNPWVPIPVFGAYIIQTNVGHFASTIRSLDFLEFFWRHLFKTMVCLNSLCSTCSLIEESF